MDLRSVLLLYFPGWLGRWIPLNQGLWLTQITQCAAYRNRQIDNWCCCEHDQGGKQDLWDQGFGNIWFGRAPKSMFTAPHVVGNNWFCCYMEQGMVRYRISIACCLLPIAYCLLYFLSPITYYLVSIPHCPSHVTYCLRPSQAFPLSPDDGPDPYAWTFM